MIPSSPRGRLFYAQLACVVALCSHAFGGTAVWNGSVDAQWSDVNNWNGPPAAVPGTGDTATFNGAGNGNTTIDLGLGITLKTLLFDTADAAGHTLGAGAPGSQTLALDAGAALTVNGDVTNDQAVAAAVTLNGGMTVTVNPAGGSGRLALAGPVSGVGSLTKLGLGLLLLEGDNRFSGGSTLGTGVTNNSTNDTASANSGGFVHIGQSSAFGTGKITAKGAQLRALAPDLVITNEIEITNGAFRFGGTNDLRFTGPMTIVGGNREIGNYSGNRTLTLDGPLSMGTYTLNIHAVGSATANGATLFNGPIFGSGTLIVNASYDNGTVVFTADNGTTFTGSVQLNAGATRITHTNALGRTGTILMNESGATLELADGMVYARNVTIGDGGNNKAIGTAAGDAAEYAGTLTIQETTANNFDFAPKAGSTLRFSGDIGTSVIPAVEKQGEGTLVLPGAKSFTGTFTLGNGTGNTSWDGTASAGSAGYVAIGHADAFGSALINAKGAQLQALVGGLVITNAITVDSGALRFGGTNDLELSGPVTMINASNRSIGNYSGNRTLTLSGTVTSQDGISFVIQANDNAPTNGVTRFTGAIAGGGNIDVDGTFDNGLAIMAGANSYTGTTAVKAGTLRLDYSAQDNSKLADAARLTMQNGIIELAGGTHLEQVGETWVAGNARLTRSSGSAVLALGALNVQGALRLGAEDIASTTSDNTNGLLPGVTVQTGSGTRWAANSGVSDSGSGSLIRAFGGALAGIDRLGGVIPDDAALNAAIVNGGVSGNVSLAALTNAVNTLTMDADDGPATVDLAGGRLTVGGEAGGGVIQTATSGALTIGAVPGDGVLTTGGLVSGTPAALVLANDSATQPITIRSAIQNNGTDGVSLSKQGAGKVILTGTNDYTGGTLIEAGVLQIGDDGLTGTLGTGLCQNNGDLLATRGAGSGDLLITPSIVGAGKVTHAGASTARLILRGGTSGYSGGTTAHGGILRAEDGSNDNQLLAFGTGPVTLHGGTLEARANGSADQGVIVTGDGKTGNDLFLAANTTLNVQRYSGTTRFGNTIQFNNLTLGGSTLTFAGNHRYRAAFAGTVTLTNDVTFNTSFDNTEAWLALDGPVTDNGQGFRLTKLGLGTLMLCGDNTFSGGATLGTGTGNTATPESATASASSGGFVLLGHNHALGTGPVLSLGTQVRALAPGLVIPNDVAISNGGFRFGGSHDLTFSGKLTALSSQRGIGNYSRDKTLTLGDIDISSTTAVFEGLGSASPNGITHVTGVISGGNALTLNANFANGRVIFSGPNTYSGATIINSGTTLQLGDGGTTGSLNPSSDISNSGTLIFDRSDTLTQGTDFDGVLSGTGTVAAAGSGMVVLTGANTYTGPTVINPGATLQLGNGGTAGSLSLSSPILADGTLAVNRSDTVTQGTHFHAVVDGAGGVRQAGSGTLVLTGANTYTGLTAVTSGTLLVNGEQTLATGPATVAAGAILGGTGVCGSAGTVAAGGILSPGTAGVGTLTLGSLTLQQGAVYRWDVSSAANDTVDVTGDLMLPDGFTLNVNRLEPGALRQKVLFTYGGSYVGPEAAVVTTTGGATAPYRTLHDAANTRILLEAIQTGTLITVQ
jgi:autotransporter-associated beta strand protein